MRVANRNTHRERDAAPLEPRQRGVSEHIDTPDIEMEERS